MPAQDPESGNSSDLTPDRFEAQVKLSYDYHRNEKLEHLAKEVEAQSQLDKLWNDKLTELERAKDLHPGLSNTPELQQIDAHRERMQELEARAAKEIARSSHAMERLEDTERGNINEGRKLMYDWFKHLTTLGTGSLVILGALSNNLLSNASFLIFLPFIFLFLFASVVGALIYMYLVSDLILTSTTTRGPSKSQSGKASWLVEHIGSVFLTTLGLFGFGIFLFVVFATLNLLI